MPVLSGAAVFLQDNMPDFHLASISLLIIAIVMVIELLGLLVAAGFALKMVQKANGVVEQVDKRITPILDGMTKIMNEMVPKVQSLTENVEEISQTVRAKVDELGATVSELNETVREINGRTRAQVTRVDGMVTEALTATEEISQSVQHGIKAPIRQIAGVVAGVRAGIDKLIERSPFGKRDIPGPYDL